MRRAGSTRRSSSRRCRSPCCRSLLDVAGLPLRSAIDVVVFAIACMGLNILVGYTGLVSFGHGAWFGLGGLCGGAEPALLVSRRRHPAGAVRHRCSSRSPRCCRGRADPAPARRLFLAADAGAHRAAVRHRLSLDRAHRRRERARRRDPVARAWRRSRRRLDLLLWWSPRSASAFAICSGAFIARRSAACWWRSARTSSARASSAIRPTVTS